MSLTIEERFARALHNSARAWRLALDRRMKDLGLSQASWLAIGALAKSGPLPQTELARLLGIEDPSMVAMVDRMVKAGHMERQPSPTDRRVKLIHLTDGGLAVYAHLRSLADPFREELLGGVDRNQLAMMTDFLESLQAAIESKA
jgi:MarR family transcriptional regulator for hemolysin